jgi:hypothetical protein
MTMPDPLARRNGTLPVFQQYPVNAPVPTTQAQLAKAGSLGLTVLDAKDHAFQQIEGRVNKGGRSYSHQRYFEGQAAITLHTLTTAYDEIYRGEMRKIVDNQPRDREREVVTVTQVEKTRAPGAIGYLFGR